MLNIVIFMYLYYLCIIVNIIIIVFVFFPITPSFMGVVDSFALVFGSI